MLPDKQQSAQACSRCGHSRHLEGVKCPATSANVTDVTEEGITAHFVFPRLRNKHFQLTLHTDELSVDTTGR